MANDHTDILKRLRDLGMSGPIEQVLACDWGRRIATKTDPEPCGEQAVQITVLHQHEREESFKFCKPHTDLVLKLTNPRK